MQQAEKHISAAGTDIITPGNMMLLQAAENL
jgi:hypothetical protein